MVKQITAFKLKDGSIYEEKSEALKEQLSSDLYDVLEGCEDRKYHVIEFIKENPVKFYEILKAYVPAKNKKGN